MFCMKIQAKQDMFTDVVLVTVVAIIVVIVGIAIVLCIIYLITIGI